MERIAVIGGGMAGMAAAHRLKTAGLEPVVFERNDRVGGRIWTIEKGGFLMDLGAAVYLGTYKEAIELIREVGLGGELRELPGIGSMPRDGKLHDFDYSKPIRTALTTKAISPMGKLRMLPLAAMLLGNLKHLGYADYTGIAAVDNETTQSYSRRALTKELEQYATEPLVRGTWAADDAESSNALMLWSAKNMLAPTVWSLDSGMDALARHIAAGVEVRYGAEVENVTDEGTRVEVTAGGKTETFAGAIIATTAGPALSMFPQMDANHRTLYENARYRGLITVALGLGRPPRDKATYILLPRVEDPDVIAVIADHHKALRRAPDNKSMYTLLFSHEYLHRTRDYSEERIIEEAIACVERYHGKVSDAVEQTQVVRWDEVVPVVGQGAFKRIAGFQDKLDGTQRVQFASDLDRIPGVNGALVSGLEAAKRIAAGRSAWKQPALATS
ncbi:MAG: protoporphyrinogen/coproporphyrinogen oxidase [Solirubrobacteraceae bacterium]|jgi:oxygen-dependent protoporphyrinogen oxidase|nr:protoporphyrinogen/coproporphyrinogen oxidase [Solirubrobacteraceae bacterium]